MTAPRALYVNAPVRLRNSQELLGIVLEIYQDTQVAIIRQSHGHVLLEIDYPVRDLRLYFEPGAAYGEEDDQDGIFDWWDERNAT